MRQDRFDRKARTKPAVERLRQRLAHAEDGWFFARIADQVVERRRERGLSQAELATLCGTTQSAIARLESGGRPPRIDTLLRIASALGCELVVELRPGRRSGRDERSGRPPNGQ
ncbi:MAG: helix-turn-helix domain-containing protein [Actinomycetota bacterium]|nr:helix-turn-helix domain-containing protein [Actinomycetota bacterium]